MENPAKKWMLVLDVNSEMGPVILYGWRVDTWNVSQVHGQLCLKIMVNGAPYKHQVCSDNFTKMRS